MGNCNKVAHADGHPEYRIRKGDAMKKSVLSILLVTSITIPSLLTACGQSSSGTSADTVQAGNTSAVETAVSGDNASADSSADNSAEITSTDTVSADSTPSGEAPAMDIDLSKYNEYGTMETAFFKDWTNVGFATANAGNNGSPNWDTPFQDGMKFETRKYYQYGGEIADAAGSVLPVSLSTSPLISDLSFDSWFSDGDKEQIMANLGSQGWINYLSLKTVAGTYLTFSTEDRQISALGGYYLLRTDGNRLIFTPYCIGEGDTINVMDSSAEYEVNYSLSDDGQTLTLERDGITREYVNKTGQELLNQPDNWQAAYEGNCIDENKRYGNIVGISLLVNKEDVGTTKGISLNFPYGGYTSGKAQIVNNHHCIISWDNYHVSTYDSDGNYTGSQTVDEPGNFEADFFELNQGFLMKVGDTWYPYLTWSLDSATVEKYVPENTDVSSLSGDQKSQLEAEAGAIIADLSDAFSNNKINCTIDPNTGEVSLSNDLLFAFDDATLSDDAKKYLDGFMDAYSSIIQKAEYSNLVASITVEGHTDTLGSYDYNLALSEKRAKAVADYCTQKHPELSGLITSVGKSYDDPVLDENGQIDMDASRRVLFAFRLKVN
jgi:outer membrane protein OmpA-like peptidoglycan-associated protein